MVAPVPYSMRSELKGSISMSPTIQPSLGLTSGSAGLAPNVSQGAPEMSWT